MSFSEKFIYDNQEFKTGDLVSCKSNYDIVKEGMFYVGTYEDLSNIARGRESLFGSMACIFNDVVNMPHTANFNIPENIRKLMDKHGYNKVIFFATRSDSGHLTDGIQDLKKLKRDELESTILKIINNDKRSIR